MSTLDWTVLLTAAVLVGFAKTAIGGIGALATALFATVLPARQSSGALLPLLIAGDIVAVTAYRRHADWTTLWRLFPSVAAGVVVGAGFVAEADDTVMRRTIGVLLVGLVALTLVQRRRRTPLLVTGRGASVMFGLMAGFTTMVANAAGPVMAIYLLATGISMMGFLGHRGPVLLLVNLFQGAVQPALGRSTSARSARLPVAAERCWSARWLPARVTRPNQRVPGRLVLFLHRAAEHAQLPLTTAPSPAQRPGLSTGSPTPSRRPARPGPPPRSPRPARWPTSSSGRPP